VFGSSRSIVDLVTERTGKPATLLPIATNPDRFGRARARPDRACDVLFVGGYWKQHRGVVDALPYLAEHGFSVHVHGHGWDTVESFAGLDRGFLDYESVPDAYASARIVVDDAASSTRARGSVNSRVFDALAAGAIVVTNGASGVHELFDDEFPIWTDAEDLERLVERILADPTAEAERAARYRSRILADHTYRRRAETLRDAWIDWAAATRYAIRIGVPDRMAYEHWGDYYFARSLQRRFEAAGHPTRLQFLPDWTAPAGAREDVTLHLLGLSEAPTRPGQVNVLWQISHPDLATPALYDRYDRVYVASDPFTARMAADTATPVEALHQATDPDVFRTDIRGPHHELLFVANSRKVRRRIVDDLEGTTHDLAVYGLGWTPELIDMRYVRGGLVPNVALPGYYAAADIVLNDHWDDMREAGFISNRLYDASAAGAFVISDDVPGIGAEFDGAVVTYSDREELERLIDRYLADPAERHRLAERGRRIVLERHTFEDRARVIREAVDPLVAARPRRILEGTPEPLAALSAPSGYP